MIKYLELTAPEKSEFRQVKIVSIEVSEGDEVAVGDPLFKVKSGDKEIDLPATMEGKVAEVIATLDENISVMTPLILLETEVDGSTATPPINLDEVQANPKSKSAANVKAEPTANSASKESSTSKESSASKEQEPNKDKEAVKSKGKKKTKTKKSNKKAHRQQSLNLDPDSSNDTDDFDEEDNNQQPETQALPKTIETTTMSKIQISVPDIGADNAKVIDIFVTVGDNIEIDDPLVTLESDKASMDVPSTYAGTITSISVAPDQDVSEGDILVELSLSDNSDGQEDSQTANQEAEENDLTPEIVASNQIVDVVIPDIGGDSAKVIEILVEVGQSINTEDPLVTLESDKASMDVPSTTTGEIESIEVNVDQDVSQGMVVVKVKSSHETVITNSADSTSSTDVSAEAMPSVVDITIPDIGGDSAKVIEILVEVGQDISVEDPLVTLESDKASMDVPSTVAGTVESIDIEVEQDVSQGMLVAKVLSTVANSAPSTHAAKNSEPATTPASTSVKDQGAASSTPPALAPVTGKAHASPSIRRFARELGVDLSKVGGSGRKGRVVKDDVKAFVKSIMLGGQTAQTSGAGIPPIPAVDFSKFGDIDIQPLNKIKKLTAKNLHRSWLNVPHVTHNDESNITDLEEFRKQLNKENAAQENGIKLSPLAFIVKAVVNALKKYPQFNSSLEPGGDNIIYKKYIHVGIAVETPNGLVVPVIRDADKKSISEIAIAMGELAKKARDKKLSPADMSGASFTISSLGGIGGTSFTPIVNAPEVAILGVARSKMQPVWDGKEFNPAMILPLSLSYDHRIIDGAEAARFTAHIAAALEDVRRLTV